MTTEVQKKYLEHCKLKGFTPITDQAMGTAMRKVFPEIKHQTIYIYTYIERGKLC